MNCTIRVAKTKALISFAVTAKLNCAFVFAYAICWFSLDAAHTIKHPSESTKYTYGTRLIDLRYTRKLSERQNWFREKRLIAGKRLLLLNSV